MHAGTIGTPLRERWELRSLQPCDVPEIRGKVRRKVAEGGYAADDAELVTSELLANLINHAHGFGALWVEIRENEVSRESELFIGVSDHSPDKPEVKHADLKDTCGRGMFLVERLASSWDVVPMRNGKLVYALLPLRQSGDDKDSSWGATPQ